MFLLIEILLQRSFYDSSEDFHPENVDQLFDEVDISLVNKMDHENFVAQLINLFEYDLQNV